MDSIGELKENAEVFVVVRVRHPEAEYVVPQNRADAVMTPKAFSSEARAEEEAERLNALGDSFWSYFVLPARFMPSGDESSDRGPSDDKPNRRFIHAYVVVHVPHATNPVGREESWDDVELEAVYVSEGAAAEHTRASVLSGEHSDQVVRLVRLAW